MENNKVILLEDGDQMRSPVIEAPPFVDLQKLPILDGNVKRRRRRGKSKRNVIKPFKKMPWQDRRSWKNEKSTRNNRYRKIVLTKTQAPFNNNQFLMEIHKPEPENTFNILQTPSARTRDSSFSVDSDDNYFFSLPEDEEEYLTKEFSSVYEDAQCERLSNMTKNELIQEFLLLEAKYDNLIKRTERTKYKQTVDEAVSEEDKDISVADKESMVADRDTSETSFETSGADDPSMSEVLQRMKEQEEQIQELQVSNEKLRLENEHLRQRNRNSSEDSESDSSSTSDSDSSSSDNESVLVDSVTQNGQVAEEPSVQMNGQHEGVEDILKTEHVVNGFHNSNGLN